MRLGAAVLITGASSGIGRATAFAFAERRCRLILAARSADALAELGEQISTHYQTDVVPVPCDVRRDEDVQRLAAIAVARLGRIDVAVLNAGAGLYARVEDTTEQDFRVLLDTNLLGVHHAIRAIVPIMRRQRYGRLVIVGSVVSKESWPYHGAYSATKFALAGLTQALRAELTGSGVAATLVLPGSTRTNFFARAKVNVPGYEPRPIFIVQPPELVAAKILRAVDHPKPEVLTTPFMRAAFVISVAFPCLPDLARKAYYRFVVWRLSRKSRSSSEVIEETTDTIDGQH